jgi:hypothetical protein
VTPAPDYALALAAGRPFAGDEMKVALKRFDQQKYRYALWRPNPLAKWRKTQDETFLELAHKYFEWLGPATARDFQEFAGIGVKAARAAREPLKALEEAVRKTEAFIREDLGDARGFSLDSPKSRVPRIEAILKAKA